MSSLCRASQGTVRFSKLKLIHMFLTGMELGVVPTLRCRGAGRAAPSTAVFTTTFGCHSGLALTCCLHGTCSIFLNREWTLNLVAGKTTSYLRAMQVLDDAQPHTWAALHPDINPNEYFNHSVRLIASANITALSRQLTARIRCTIRGAVRRCLGVCYI